MPNKRDTKEVRRESAPRALVRASVTLTLMFVAASGALSNASAQKRPAAAKASAKSPASAQKGAAAARASVPPETLLQIIEAEDERRWDAAEFGKLFEDANASVRRRAALAAGRIGDEGAVAPLS